MIITQTPLRISLLGGNTDFPKYFKKYGGAVLTTTIDKYVYCIVKKRFDDDVWINYSEKEKVSNFNDIKHDLVREAMKMTNVTEGIEITFLSDVPSEGSGLGSSSAVLVGVLNALHNYKGESVPAMQLAKEAVQIEVDILKRPIGYQDQVAVAFGGFKLIEFKEDTTCIVTPITEFSTKDLMLFYTGITRKSESVLSKMKLDKKILDEIKQLTYESQGSLIGYYLNKYWQLKKKLNPAVTNAKIDAMYQEAMDLGAIGGKIVGAGAGGFLLVCVPEFKRDSFKRGFKHREFPFKPSKYGSRVIFNINE